MRCVRRAAGSRAAAGSRGRPRGPVAAEPSGGPRRPQASRSAAVPRGRRSRSRAAGGSPRRRLRGRAGRPSPAIAGPRRRGVPAPGNRAAQRSIRRRTAGGSRYIRRPCAVISTPRVASTSAIQASSRAEDAIVRCRGPSGSRRRRTSTVSVRSTPIHRTRPVVDAPGLGLEALAERDDGAVRAPLQEAPDLAVERQDAERLPLGRPARAEALGERVVDAVDEVDGDRVAQHGVGAAGLERAVVERPEERLRDALEAGVDARHVHRS